jgi:uncharacterized membrane protein
MFSLFGKKHMLDKDAQHKIVACIKEAESKTSGEIRVFVEHHCKYMDAMQRAQEIFASLGMDKTQARNAIIIYVALTDRQFALFGDVAIYEKAGGAEFWKSAAAKLTGHLRKNHVTEGLCNCIHELGTALATHFPYDPAIKKNELPDEIVFGK